MITITQMRTEHIPQLVEHQKLCFPMIPAEEWISAEKFASHIALFPAGQHVALDGERVVGQSSTFRLTEAAAFTPHTYHDITADNFFTLHDPQGEWLYGADMSVHPDYRGQHISSMLYNARKALIRQLGMRGMVACGALPGYANHRHMQVDQYVAEVVAGRIFDPTLTIQLHNGYKVRGIMHNYIDAGPSGCDATLIVWEAV